MKWSVPLTRIFTSMVRGINETCIINVDEGRMHTRVLDLSSIAIVDVQVSVPECDGGCSVGVDVNRLHTTFGSLNTKEADVEVDGGNLLIKGGKYEYVLPLVLDAKTSKEPKVKHPLQIIIDSGEFVDAIAAIKGVCDSKDGASSVLFKWDGKELRISDGNVVNIIFEEGDMEGDMPEEWLRSKFPLDYMVEFSKQAKNSSKVCLSLGDHCPMAMDIIGEQFKARYFLADRIEDEE